MNERLIPDDCWESIYHDPELFQFLGKTYKIRFFSVLNALPNQQVDFLADSQVFFSVIVSIHNPSENGREKERLR